ncbi:MAG: hypothetical protein ACHQ4H_10360 [Ktedonobacterales bacterium]
MKSRKGVATAGRLALAVGFAAVTHLLYDIEISGIEHDSGAPRTYYAITHRRDLDSIAPVPLIVAHRGWSGLSGDLRFAMRADSLERGFLARVLPRPRWLSHVLRRLSVGPVLRSVGVFPIESLRISPAERWLRAALANDGDALASQALAPAFVARLAHVAGDDAAALARQRLSWLLRWRYHLALQAYSGPELFAGEAKRRAERRAVAAVKRTLADQAEWLWQGGSLYSAPEGKFSPDGHFSPITGGFHRVLRAAPAETRVVPLAIMYDFMTAGRLRVVVDLAPAITRAPGLPPRELDACLRRAWRDAATLTCTHLASGWLARRASAAPGSARFTARELARAVYEQAHALAATGRHVDARLLAPAGVRRRTRAYLTYAARHGYVRAVDGGQWEVLPAPPMPRVALGAAGYRIAPLPYALNELEELLADG